MAQRLDPLASTPPAFDSEAVKRILRDRFGVESSSLTPLAGERDQNLRVDTADGRRLLFKISNPADGLSTVEMQAAALRHIERVDPGLPVMRVLPDTVGESWAEVRGPDGRNYPWGGVPDERDANFIDETDADGGYALRTTPVGSYVGGASWCGALDMAGNVLEWCLAGANADADVGVLRGGAWYSGSEEIRTTARVCVPSGYVCNGFGFRVARRLPAGS